MPRGGAGFGTCMHRAQVFRDEPGLLTSVPHLEAAGDLAADRGPLARFWHAQEDGRQDDEELEGPVELSRVRGLKGREDEVEGVRDRAGPHLTQSCGYVLCDVYVGAVEAEKVGGADPIHRGEIVGTWRWGAGLEERRKLTSGIRGIRRGGK